MFLNFFIYSVIFKIKNFLSKAKDMPDILHMASFNRTRQ